MTVHSGRTRQLMHPIAALIPLAAIRARQYLCWQRSGGGAGFGRRDAQLAEGLANRADQVGQVPAAHYRGGFGREARAVSAVTRLRYAICSNSNTQNSKRSREEQQMLRILRLMPAMLAAAMLAAGLTAVAPLIAQAQEAVSEDQWQPVSPPWAIVQPDKSAPPLELAGCWSGELDDDQFGTGFGFALVVQNRKKITKGTIIGASFVSGPSGSHGIKGHVNSKQFKLHLSRGGCNVNIRGTLASGDLVGTYRFTRRCVGDKLAGTFDFAFDPSGTSCP
jgi:hypothetical protein